jgi:flagellar biosynthesis/type III secretory pathway protein FliH
MPSLEEDARPKSREEVLQEIEELQRKAYEEGFSAGEKAGYKEGEQKALLLVNRLGVIIDEITEFKKNLNVSLEGQVLSLSVAIARKIIADEIATRPELIVNLVREALKRLHLMGAITVKMNPALYDLFRERRPELTELHEDIVFDVSSGVALAGPLVISQTEEVVTDVDSLIDNIVDELKSVKEELNGRDSDDAPPVEVDTTATPG